MIRELGPHLAQVNVNGGGLGRPIGASGAGILVQHLMRGIATLRIRGRMSIALAVENV